MTAHQRTSRFSVLNLSRPFLNEKAWIIAKMNLQKLIDSMLLFIRDRFVSWTIQVSLNINWTLQKYFFAFLSPIFDALVHFVTEPAECYGLYSSYVCPGTLQGFLQGEIFILFLSRPTESCLREVSDMVNRRRIT